MGAFDAKAYMPRLCVPQPEDGVTTDTVHPNIGRHHPLADGSQWGKLQGYLEGVCIPFENRVSWPSTSGVHPVLVGRDPGDGPIVGPVHTKLSEVCLPDTDRPIIEASPNVGLCVNAQAQDENVGGDNLVDWPLELGIQHSNAAIFLPCPDVCDPLSLDEGHALHFTFLEARLAIDEVVGVPKLDPQRLGLEGGTFAPHLGPGA
mmetsp:Transcript_124898/g.216509  ORF Transcript_124898/g.216509 Transcript_124898/m.216509 type:complete len:204 (+) Transcript_124898:682-1293(+)